MAWCFAHVCLFFLVVLSSDDEEGCVVSRRSSRAAHKLASLEDAVMQEESAQEDKSREASDTEDMQVGRMYLARKKRSKLLE